MILER